MMLPNFILAQSQQSTEMGLDQKIDKAENKLGNVNTLGAGVFYDFNSPIDKLLQQRKELEKSRLESIEAEKRFRRAMQKSDDDKGQGLAQIIGGDDA